MALQDDLVLQTERLLLEMGPLLDSISTIEMDAQKHTWPLVARSALIRQHDYLEAICHLVRARRAYAAVPLLRPLCEDLIMTTFLRTLPEDEAQRIVLALSQIEIAGALEAQQKVSTEDEMWQLGLEHHHKAFRGAAEKARDELLGISKVHGWKTRSKLVPFPTVAEAARLIGRYEDLYGFLYHATSRAVHFQPSELLRRVWGPENSDTMTIDSTHHSRYWEEFAVRWGLMLYIESIPTILQVVSQVGYPEGFDGESLIAALAEAKAGSVPIITEQELGWPTRAIDKIVGLRKPGETKTDFLIRLRTMIQE